MALEAAREAVRGTLRERWFFAIRLPFDAFASEFFMIRIRPLAAGR
jgi:hypothetical protein